MSRKQSTISDDLEDRDPNNLGSHLQLIVPANIGRSTFEESLIVDPNRLQMLKVCLMNMTMNTWLSEVPRFLMRLPFKVHGQPLDDLNSYQNVSWSDVIGEPKSVRSPECAWRVGNYCFVISKNFCYVFLSVLCAPITACCLGLSFSCLAFQHIWCIIPYLRIWKISCGATRIFVESCTQGIIVPIADGLGRFWSEIRVRNQTISEEKNDKIDVLQI